MGGLQQAVADACRAHEAAKCAGDGAGVAAIGRMGQWGSSSMRKRVDPISVDKSFTTGPGVVPPEGTLMLWAAHEHSSWATNPNPYHFPPSHVGGVTVHAHKTPDGTINVSIDGLHGGRVAFKPHRIPKLDAQGLAIFITWGPDYVALTLGSRKTKPRQVERIERTNLSH